MGGNHPIIYAAMSPLLCIYHAYSICSCILLWIIQEASFSHRKATQRASDRVTRTTPSTPPDFAWGRSDRLSPEQLADILNPPPPHDSARQKEPLPISARGLIGGKRGQHLRWPASRWTSSDRQPLRDIGCPPDATPHDSGLAHDPLSHYARC